MRYKKKNRIKFNRTNWQIRAETIRLLDNQGKQIGVFPIQKAREIAREKELDLVEIAANAKPPVVKLIDYAKFKYGQKKKAKEERKKSKKGEKIKEIRLTPFIGEADLKTRLNRAEGFAQEGDRMRIVVKFLGRQITQKQFGYELLEKVQEKLKDFYEKDGQARLAGKRLILFMKPIKKEKKDEQKSKKSKQKENSQVGG